MGLYVTDFRKFLKISYTQQVKLLQLHTEYAHASSALHNTGMLEDATMCSI